MDHEYNGPKQIKQRLTLYFQYLLFVRLIAV